jgi:hypothetical protein
MLAPVAAVVHIMREVPLYAFVNRDMCKHSLPSIDPGVARRSFFLHVQ